MTRRRRGDRMMLHVRQGKNAKDRYVPIPIATVELLRACWALHRHPVLLFPSVGRRPTADRAKTMHPSTIQKAFKLARNQSGAPSARNRQLCILFDTPTQLIFLRQVRRRRIRIIQQYLGHTSINTTMRYTHLTGNGEQHATTAIENLMAEIPSTANELPW